MRDKPLIIGESPSQAGDRYHRFPLSGNPARAICKLADLDVPDDAPVGDFYWTMVEHFDTANAVERYPGKTWPTEEARRRVERLVQGYKVVVLLGRRAQAAYPNAGIRDKPFFEWSVDALSRHGDRSVVTIPHSSGLNRVYNDPEARERASVVLNRALDLVRR